MRRALYAVAAWALLLSACAGERTQLDLRLGHVASPGSLTAVSAEEFAKRANQRLGDLGHVTVFGSSQLGDDETLLIKLKLGTVDFSVPSTIMSSAVASFGLFEMPYLVRDREHMRRIEQELVWPRLAPDAAARGYELLAVWENGFRHITNDTRPIEGPDDLRGIKLRTPRGRWRVRLFQTFGANPTPMSLSETFIALQTGVIDGQENPLSQIHSQKFHEVQKFLTLSSHVYTPAFLLAGRDRWQSLPEPIREILSSTAREIQAFVYEQAESLDESLLADLRLAGIAVNECDRERFLAAGQPLFAEFAREVPQGGEMVAKALALAQAER
ncbi:MAG: TRAP transporter substrate-binding protein [Bryobacterales bacterium]|nr:TRAP transporter substrate-binding protein [Bryobacterales bacterium]